MAEIKEADTLLDVSIELASQLGGGILFPPMAGRNEDLAVTVVALPLPPSANSLFPTRGGRRVKSVEYVAWQYEANLWVTQQPHLTRYGAIPMAPPKAHWTLHQYIFLDSWRSDMDNRYKASIDWLCKFYGVNDRYLVQHSAIRCTGKLTGIVNILGWEV